MILQRINLPKDCLHKNGFGFINGLLAGFVETDLVVKAQMSTIALAEIKIHSFLKKI